MLTLVVGAILVLASLLRLASSPILSLNLYYWIQAAIGLVIITDQIPKILVSIFPKASFLHSLLAIFHGIPEASLPTLSVGICNNCTFGRNRAFPSTPARSADCGSCRDCRHISAAFACAWRSVSWLDS